MTVIQIAEKVTRETKFSLDQQEVVPESDVIRGILNGCALGLCLWVLIFEFAKWAL